MDTTVTYGLHNDDHDSIREPGTYAIHEGNRVRAGKPEVPKKSLSDPASVFQPQVDDDVLVELARMVSKEPGKAGEQVDRTTRQLERFEKGVSSAIGMSDVFSAPTQQPEQGMSAPIGIAVGGSGASSATAHQAKQGMSAPIGIAVGGSGASSAPTQQPEQGMSAPIGIAVGGSGGSSATAHQAKQGMSAPIGIAVGGSGGSSATAQQPEQGMNTPMGGGSSDVSSATAHQAKQRMHIPVNDTIGRSDVFSATAQQPKQGMNTPMGGGSGASSAAAHQAKQRMHIPVNDTIGRSDVFSATAQQSKQGMHTPTGAPVGMSDVFSATAQQPEQGINSTIGRSNMFSADDEFEKDTTSYFGTADAVGVSQEEWGTGYVNEVGQRSEKEYRFKRDSSVTELYPGLNAGRKQAHLRHSAVGHEHGNVFRRKSGGSAEDVAIPLPLRGHSMVARGGFGNGNGNGYGDEKMAQEREGIGEVVRGVIRAVGDRWFSGGARRLVILSFGVVLGGLMLYYGYGAVSGGGKPDIERPVIAANADKAKVYPQAGEGQKYVDSYPPLFSGDEVERVSNIVSRQESPVENLRLAKGGSDPGTDTPRMVETVAVRNREISAAGEQGISNPLLRTAEDLSPMAERKDSVGRELTVPRSSRYRTVGSERSGRSVLQFRNVVPPKKPSPASLHVRKANVPLSSQDASAFQRSHASDALSATPKDARSSGLRGRLEGSHVNGDESLYSGMVPLLKGTMRPRLKSTVLEGDIDNEKGSVPSQQRRQAVSSKSADATKTTEADSAKEYVVQVSSHTDMGEAKKASVAARWKYKVLAGMIPVIQEVDLGSRGIFYRVRFPVGPRDKAVDICNKLRAEKSACIVVRK